MHQLPFDTLELLLTNTDQQLSATLQQQAAEVHICLQSHHSLGTLARVNAEFMKVEQYLKRVVRHRLGWRSRLVLYLRDFFVDNKQDGRQLETALNSLKTCLLDLLRFHRLLQQKSVPFIRCLSRYAAWLAALSRQLPGWTEQAGGQAAGLIHTIAGLTGRGGELLAAQRQLETTIFLQQQRNEAVLTDIRHIVSVASSLASNAVTAEQFFEREFSGSINRIRRYTKG